MKNRLLYIQNRFAEAERYVVVAENSITQFNIDTAWTFVNPLIYGKKKRELMARLNLLVVVVPGDTTAPVITLTGGNMAIDEGTPYAEPGFSAVDDVDGDITANVVVNYGGLNVNDPVEGSYQITYNVSDAAGNAAAQKSRTVTVEAVVIPDTTAPIITLTGGNVTIDEGTPYIEPGFSAVDDVDGDITANVVVSYGGLNVNNPAEGVFTITYNVSDDAGNPALQKSRTVTVEAVEIPVDTTPPSAPGNVQVINITYDEARVTWAASTDNVAVRGYAVYQLISGVWLQMSIESSDLFHDLQNIGPGLGDDPNEYTIKVRAFDTSGNFADSASVTFETWSAPGTKGNTTITNISDTSVKIDWAGAVPGTFALAGYNVYLNEVKLNTSLITATEYTFTNLTPGTTYTYHVECVDVNGRSTGAPGTTYGAGSEFTTTGTAPTLSPEHKELVTFSSSVFSGETTKYYLYEPEGTQQAADDSLPCIIHLHGLGEFRDKASGESAKDALIWKNGPPKHIHAGDDLDTIGLSNFIVYSPQQPYGTNFGNTIPADRWNDAYMMEIYNIAVANPKVDPNKVFITGLSMGAMGALRFASQNPSLISKVLVTCPNVGFAIASVFETKPLWIIHGTADSTAGGFGVGTSNTFVNDVKTTYPGAPIKYTRPSGVGHDSWTKTFNAVGWALAELSADANGNGVDEIGNGTGNNPYVWLMS